MRRRLVTQKVRDSYDFEWAFTLCGPDDSDDPTKPPYIVVMTPPDQDHYADGDTIRFDARAIRQILEVLEAEQSDEQNGADRG